MLCRHSSVNSHPITRVRAFVPLMLLVPSWRSQVVALVVICVLCEVLILKEKVNSSGAR